MSDNYKNSELIDTRDCPYCRKGIFNKPIVLRPDGFNRTPLEVEIILDELCITVFENNKGYMDGVPTEINFYAEIKFCPMCGESVLFEEEEVLI